MKRLIAFLVPLVLLFTAWSAPALAATDYTFKLTASASGSLKVGDEVTVTLTLTNNNGEAFSLYAMQDYILYDRNHFEYVAGSATYDSALVVSQLSMTASQQDALRVSYLSLDGTGKACEASTVLVRFKLKALKLGTTTLTHYLPEMSSRTARLYAVSTVNAKLGITSSGGHNGGGSDSGSDDTPSQLPFFDVKSNDWYYDAVRFAVENSLFAGTSTTTFSPQTAMTRAMLVTVLYRLEGQPTTGTAGFSDVAGGNWYTNGVAWAAGTGIVTGFGDQTFRPGQPLTREQLAAILYRYSVFKGFDVSAGGDLSVFSDRDKINDYALTSLQWAVGKGLLSGKGNAILDPTGNATRAEVATILMRYWQLYL